jgi:hypothetical protein
VNEDPYPFFDERILRSIERLLQFDPPPAIRRALRWYRIGLNASLPEDQFIYFWFALEILAEYQKAPEKVTDNCPHCRSALYCETCDTHPTHRPYAKQAILALIKAVEPACEEETLEALDKCRNALMHGATLKEIESSLPKFDEHIVDVLGRILFKALVNQFPRQIFEEEVQIGAPTTYLHLTMSAFAHVRTVFPEDESGEVDLSRPMGLKVSMGTDGPPQSGRPSRIAMTLDQYKQLALLTHEKGDHVELCKRVHEKAKVVEGKVIASVLSTDMVRIREALKRGEMGNWQNLFREIMVGNPSSG